MKLLTDLVVFPLLFTYRGARIMKRRLSKVWNRWTSSSSSSSTKATSSSNDQSDIINLESYNANSSTPISDQR
jgi:hypothetical protein